MALLAEIKKTVKIDNETHFQGQKPNSWDGYGIVTGQFEGKPSREFCPLKTILKSGSFIWLEGPKIRFVGDPEIGEIIKAHRDKIFNYLDELREERASILQDSISDLDDGFALQHAEKYLKLWLIGLADPEFRKSMDALEALSPKAMLNTSPSTLDLGNGPERF